MHFVRRYYYQIGWQLCGIYWEIGGALRGVNHESSVRIFLNHLTDALNGVYRSDLTIGMGETDQHYTLVKCDPHDLRFNSAKGIALHNPGLNAKVAPRALHGFKHGPVLQPRRNNHGSLTEGFTPVVEKSLNCQINCFCRTGSKNDLVRARV